MAHTFLTFATFFRNYITDDNVTSIYILSTTTSEVTKKDVIKRMELKPIYKCKTNDQLCSICCVNITTKEYIRELFCKHKFHKRCVDEWLYVSFKEKKKTSCPLCRKTVNLA